jgi:peptidoglycan hydrolase CwlO-like protein
MEFSAGGELATIAEYSKCLNRRISYIMSNFNIKDQSLVDHICSVKYAVDSLIGACVTITDIPQASEDEIEANARRHLDIHTYEGFTPVVPTVTPVTEVSTNKIILENNSLKEENDSLIRRNSMLEEEVKQLESDNSKNQKETIFDEFKKEHDSLKKEYKTLKKDYDSLVRECTNTKANNNRFKADHKNVSDKNKELSKNINTLEAGHKNVLEKNEELQRSMDTLKDDYKNVLEKNKELERSMGTLKDDYKNVLERNRELERNMNTLNEKLEKNEDIKRDFEALKRDISQIEEKFETVKEKNTPIKTPFKEVIGSKPAPKNLQQVTSVKKVSNRKDYTNTKVIHKSSCFLHRYFTHKPESMCFYKPDDLDLDDDIYIAYQVDYLGEHTTQKYIHYYHNGTGPDSMWIVCSDGFFREEDPKNPGKVNLAKLSGKYQTWNTTGIELFDDDSCNTESVKQ